MRKCRSGFTLVELLIVMGIIVLFITMAIPSIRVMTGSHSISAAQNQLAAVLTRAREDAIALQAPRGVMFYLDPPSGRVGAVIVQQTAITDTTNIRFNTVLLDTLPGNDSLLLPVGVRLQTLFNGMNRANGIPSASSSVSLRTMQQAMAAQAQLSASQQDDRYMGFNAVQGATIHGSGTNFYIGGCILFDGSGRLIVRPYGFQMTTYKADATPGPSNLCKFMGFDVSVGTDGTTTSTYPVTGATFTNSVSNSIVIMPGCPNNANYTTGNYFPTVPVMSQIGLVLFDSDAFKTLGFTDADNDIQPGPGYTTAWPTTIVGYGVGGGGGDGIHSEADEENWLDANSTPIMINRYNGTLIRGE